MKKNQRKYITYNILKKHGDSDVFASNLPDQFGLILHGTAFGNSPAGVAGGVAGM